ncbi:hypothetical protein GGTG_00021 [Gaeumannomyces tritici R3-111a-1]|uniref:Uncharacterized protein n=1 Tax=Gaeumannomyces tritici (strain R3-111a-1) TaxID=644352 RepID=J3NFH5_GAET3|nr:hypothetical protein GGTG_00021 [Gaeumannomyces tritici R3-111a-1]EJT80015.1 hypothetical protein GGTG_00021 [Gaeumannomyces tritici R3-111a-1]
MAAGAVVASASVGGGLGLILRKQGKGVEPPEAQLGGTRNGPTPTREMTVP